jgi:hypothetical protein
MAGGYASPSDGQLGDLFTLLSDYSRRIRELERPTGSQTASALATLQALVDGLLTQVNGIFSGYVQAGTNITAGGNVTATGTIVGNVVKTTSGPTTVITTGRVASWLQNSDGTIGTATSSERFKTNIRHMRDDIGFDPMAVLSLHTDYWEYKAEVAKRDDPESLEYVGREYRVATNFGPIAERAHDLGLWMIVVYEREHDGVTLKRNKMGEPIPYALHDSLFAYLLAIAVQVINEERLEQVGRVDALAQRLSALDGEKES